MTLTEQWNAATQQADLQWPASDNLNLDSYQMRISPGATYDAATVVGNIPPGTTTFATTAGLNTSGDVASFKVFVILGQIKGVETQHCSARFLRLRSGRLCYGHGDSPRKYGHT